MARHADPRRGAQTTGEQGHQFFVNHAKEVLDEDDDDGKGEEEWRMEGRALRCDTILEGCYMLIGIGGNGVSWLLLFHLLSKTLLDRL